jgi:hypothetical protein
VEVQDKWVVVAVEELCPESVEVLEVVEEVVAEVPVVAEVLV